MSLGLNTQFSTRARARNGFTLVETIVTIAIVSLIMVGFSFLFTRLWSVFGFTMETGVATLRATRGIDDAERLVREARQSESGGFAIASATDNEFIFYADYDNDQRVERVRYFAEGQQLKVGVTEPNLNEFPVTYDRSENITTISSEVVNDVVLGATDCNTYSLTSEINGSSQQPFTEIGMAATVNLAGQYYFNIGGNFFATQINDDGEVLVAAGNRRTNEDEYVQVSSLDYTSDQILSSAILENIGMIDEVRIKAVNGQNRPFDVRTNDNGVITRLKDFDTLGYNIDTAATWVGDGADRMDQYSNGPDDTLGDPSNGTWINACRNDNDSLNQHLYIACDNPSGLVWSHGFGPSTNVDLRREEALRDNTDNDLNLFVSAPAVSTTFNIIATKQPSGSFAGNNSVTYTESQLLSQGGVCVDSTSVPSGTNPVFSYYTDFADYIKVLETDSSAPDSFEYSAIEGQKIATPVGSTGPFDVGDINLVEIDLRVNADPLRDTSDIRINRFVNVRSLSIYDGTPQ